MNKNNSLIIVLVVCMAGIISCTGNNLKLNPERSAPERTLEFPDGKTVQYRAYENIYYVTNVVDSVYQYLNYYVPEKVYKGSLKSPIFIKTNVGGYMAAEASEPSPIDATGRALLEGYVVVIPGSRGSNSMVKTSSGERTWTGRAPAGIVDLKAAIRYLRHNQNTFPGDTERIIIDGTSAGGAMSALIGATGNNKAYEPYLKELGAAKERDDVFAAVCYCPITDLEHADMAYEWLYNTTDVKTRELSTEQIAISNELAALYPVYIDNLGLKNPEDKNPLTSANYRDYIKSFLIKSAQKARNEGFEILPETGVKLNQGFHNSPGEFVVDIDMDLYLEYISHIQELKTPPAFDKKDVLSTLSSPENNLFGDETGNSINFTEYSLRRVTGDISAAIDSVTKEKIHLMNPMNYIGDSISRVAQYWYIRHGAIDRDTGFPISVNLYTKLVNNGYNVNFALPWNRNHSGDYNLDDLFEWIENVVKVVSRK